MKRRDFITVLGGAAAWPLAARAQQTRRIGVMVALSEGDPELRKRLAAFRQALDRLGWSEGRNVYLDYRFAPGGAHAHEFAKELLTLQPDVILAFSTPVAASFQRETRNSNTETTLRDVEPAARAMGLQIQVHNASTSGDKWSTITTG
jgi:ABC-type uncharacterized transport system substrate-binding protein